MPWPLLRQLFGGDATGDAAMSDRTRALAPRIAGASVARSVCPYCAVGCGQLIFHRDGELVSVEGDPGSPISEGHLCPKGAATFELLTHAGAPDDGEVPPAVRDRVAGPAIPRPRST